MKIAITGHRPNKLGNDYDLTSDLIQNIEHEIVKNLLKLCPKDTEFKDYFIFITGMALGIDTLFAKMAIDMNIPFIAAIPFHGQQLKWSKNSIQIYADIISNIFCDVKVVSNGTYAPYKMQIRNQWMVDNCDILIAVWDGSSGGTKNCVEYAKKQGKEIIFINPKDFK